MKRLSLPLIAALLCSAAAFAQNGGGHDVRILRDTYGVPHIFGRTDADASFGLAWAHCEDDFATIQDTLISGRSLGGAVSGADAAPVDFMVHLLGVWDSVNAKYEKDLSPEVRTICEAYAAGVNLYAERHLDAVKFADVFPVSGKDIVVGFAFKGPFFFGLDNAVLELFGDTRKREVSKKIAKNMGDDVMAFAAARDFLTKDLPTGSNTFAVSSKRSSDGSTMLNINSHQPWTGPVAWYEAHMHSEEGMDSVGGTFPGAPIILHGHNRNLGWAHTVNGPDLVDIYVLEMNPDNEDQYRFDGKWLDLERKEVTIAVRINPDKPMTMKVKREVLRSVHGPVLRQKHGVYAIRYAGMGEIRQVEQWYRMNKAKNLDEWMDAMRIRATASLNSGYADKAGNILYLYNAMIPIRKPGYDYRQYLPGDTSETLWDTYLAFDDMPKVLNPPSGFVQNCNATPFTATIGEGNPKAADYPADMGIETRQSNRSLRALEQFEADKSVTWEEFQTYKWDIRYSTKSFAGKMVSAIRSATPPTDELTQKAATILGAWDLDTNEDNTATALGIMTALPLSHGRFDSDLPGMDEVWKAVKKSAETLMAKYGRLDPPWKEVNRLVRGKVDTGLSGGPDILHAVYGAETDGRYIGRAGDSYVLMVRWDKDGDLTSRSVHQFGSATMDESSPHYADQAPLFMARQSKPVWMDEKDIRAHLEREYRPGD
ncbi:MAG: acylase [Candidatus Hydrogenedentota bacterium]